MALQDIKGTPIASGQKVHIWGTSAVDKEYEIDINAVVVATRGRGIKFICEATGKEYLSTFIEDNRFQINVLEAALPKPVPEEKPKHTAKPKTSTLTPTESKERLFKADVDQATIVTAEQLHLISLLEEYGWYGTFYKEINGTKYQVTIAKPE